MSDLERIDELKTKPSLSPEEVEELDRLTSAEVAKPAPDDDRKRLVELRAKASRTDNETAEMERLALAESEAAGHVVPPSEDERGDPRLASGYSLFEEVLGALRHIRDTVPAAAGLAGFIHRAGYHLSAMKSPPALPESEAPPASPYHAPDDRLTAPQPDHSVEHYSV